MRNIRHSYSYASLSLVMYYIHKFTTLASADLTWRNCLSLMNPVSGEAQPSDSTCSHCRSSSVISTLGRDSASAFAHSNLFSLTNSSLTTSVADLGMISCKDNGEYSYTMNYHLHEDSITIFISHFFFFYQPIYASVTVSAHELI